MMKVPGIQQQIKKIIQIFIISCISWIRLIKQLTKNKLFLIYEQV